MWIWKFLPWIIHLWYWSWWLENWTSWMETWYVNFNQKSAWFKGKPKSLRQFLLDSLKMPKLGDKLHFPGHIDHIISITRHYHCLVLELPSCTAWRLNSLLSLPPWEFWKILLNPKLSQQQYCSKIALLNLYFYLISGNKLIVFAGSIFNIEIADRNSDGNTTMLTEGLTSQ